MNLRKKYSTIWLVVLGLTLSACDSRTTDSPSANPANQGTVTGMQKVRPKVRNEKFGKTADGRDATVFILQNSSGFEVRITDYGATVTMLKVPDRSGVFADVVLGFDSVEGYTSDAYLKANPYLGSIIGRYANRIGGAKFSLGGKQFKLAENNGSNNLHGGRKGFDKVFWAGRAVPSDSGVAIEFSYTSPDGEEGFPGTLAVKVIYTLTDNNELKIDYSATTETETVINLTHHSYFNFGGHAGGDILRHQLKIFADQFMPVDKGSIPTGEIRSVAGTPFDFRSTKEIGNDIESDDEQIKFGKGFDHNFVLNGKTGEMRLVAVVSDPASGRLMEVFTTEPGMQLYTGNYLDGSFEAKDGARYGPRSGFCLETQHFPDSPNKPAFPSAVLKPGEIYKTSTVYKFSLDADAN